MQWDDISERVINLENETQTTAVRKFLAQYGLTFSEADVDYTVAYYQEGRIVATGSLAGEVLRNIAVDESLQGQDISSSLVSHLMKEAGRRGAYHYFIFTKPDKAHLFISLGFTEIARAEPFAVLLEAGIGSIANYCREISQRTSHLPSGRRAGLVVNCNPFTLGHKAVIAKAANENDAVIVLVVSEEKSLFPFDVRIKLVREGLAEYDNVAVLPAGKYIVSAATFPGYFTRGDATVKAQTRLDAEIFARYIAPALGITRRYVGTEPYCPVTRAYNEAMAEILPQFGVEVTEMPRLTVDNDIISASKVRQLIKEGNWDAVRRMVPDTTWHYLKSPEAEFIVGKIRKSTARH